MQATLVARSTAVSRVQKGSQIYSSSMRFAWWKEGHNAVAAMAVVMFFFLVLQLWSLLTGVWSSFQSAFLPLSLAVAPYVCCLRAYPWFALLALEFLWKSRELDLHCTTIRQQSECYNLDKTIQATIMLLSLRMWEQLYGTLFLYPVF